MINVAGDISVKSLSSHTAIYKGHFWNMGLKGNMEQTFVLVPSIALKIAWSKSSPQEGRTTNIAHIHTPTEKKM